MLVTGASGGVGSGVSNFAEYAVRVATKDAPIDVVVDIVSGSMLPDLIEILSPQGRYVTCGAMGANS
ncbi:MAG: NADPH:quinone reductase-like Zn-dependent oxidoreductase [Parasphingorhabdus sp.]